MGVFSRYVIKPNENVFDVCVTKYALKEAFTNMICNTKIFKLRYSFLKI